MRDTMDAYFDSDSSWDRALRLVQQSLTPAPGLTRLVRIAWGGSFTPDEFIRGMHSCRVPSSCLMRAACDTGESVETLEAAVAQLGQRRAALILAITATCLEIIETRNSDLSCSPILREMMNSIEIGYHFGICAESIGPDHGMLIGFAQRLGISLLLGASSKQRMDALTCRQAFRAPEEFFVGYECEPYQVCSLALQRLGFGPELATAAAMAIGKLNVDHHATAPFVKDWAAAGDWIQSLTLGAKIPSRGISRERFKELLPPTEGELLPAHLEILHSQVDSIVANRSEWLWYQARSADSADRQPSPAGAPQGAVG